MVPVPLINTSFLIDLCEDMVFSPKPTPTIHGPRGGGGVLQISSDMDDQMGAKIETQKNPMPILQAIKISRATTQPGHAGTITNLQIVSNTPKHSYLNQGPQKNTCQNFPTQTKS